MNYNEKALEAHKKLRGKIKTLAKDDLDSLEKLSIYYTPGVGAVSNYIANNPEQTKNYTWTNNSVAVISDGSSVLGLGNIGPSAALPVMEGKAMIFKNFADIDAVPIVLNVHTADEIVKTIEAIAPSFGGINLEDIAAPICFEVEDRLKNDLSIPVMHDDQHGTAIVTLAGLINASKITGRALKDCKIVCLGAGAAGTAIIKLINLYAHPEDIIAVDSTGIISRNREDLNEEKKQILKFTNKNNISGNLSDSLVDADIFIGVSRPNILTQQMIKSMHKDPVIFAMANPDPEISPEDAYKAGALVVATGRSDYPNQVNNALVFPGIFRGALDNNVEQITNQHKIKAAEALASLIEKPTKNQIIPSILDKRVVSTIAKIIV
ncbi:MAG TPA: NADP-dependent malic enzyme [Candidatus Saccharimonadales bacterium]|jgi:malate dehydrogenase (oxaloacetate-decarboxylating)|nr:NADP-dependent malic enzyme [Candidatus Saccharimonadales bacterium]